MRAKRSSVSIFLLVLAGVTLFPLPRAGAQTSNGIAFTVTPGVFAAGQAVSAFLNISSTGSTVAATLQTGDRFTVTVASGIGTVTSVASPPYVSSSTLATGDFSVASGSGTNQIIVT